MIAESGAVVVRNIERRGKMLLDEMEKTRSLDVMSLLRVISISNNAPGPDSS